MLPVVDFQWSGRTIGFLLGCIYFTGTIFAFEQISVENWVAMNSHLDIFAFHPEYEFFWYSDDNYYQIMLYNEEMSKPENNPLTLLLLFPRLFDHIFNDPAVLENAVVIDWDDMLEDWDDQLKGLGFTFCTDIIKRFTNVTSAISYYWLDIKSTYVWLLTVLHKFVLLRLQEDAAWFGGDLVWLWVQTISCATFTIWARGVGPRFRPDQLSDITWKDILIILFFMFTISFSTMIL